MLSEMSVAILAQAGAPFCVHASQLRELFSQQFLYLYVYLTLPATGVQGQCVQKPIPLTCERRPGRAASRGGFSAPRQKRLRPCSRANLETEVRDLIR